MFTCLSWPIILAIGAKSSINRKVWKRIIQVADKNRIPWRQGKSDEVVLVESTFPPFSNAEKQISNFFQLVSTASPLNDLQGMHT